jgi:hypothetical protein
VIAIATEANLALLPVERHPVCSVDVRLPDSWSARNPVSVQAWMPRVVSKKLEAASDGLTLCALLLSSDLSEAPRNVELRRRSVLVCVRVVQEPLSCRRAVVESEEVSLGQLA